MDSVLLKLPSNRIYFKLCICKNVLETKQVPAEESGYGQGEA